MDNFSKSARLDDSEQNAAEHLSSGSNAALESKKRSFPGDVAEEALKHPRPNARPAPGFEQNGVSAATAPFEPFGASAPGTSAIATTAPSGSLRTLQAGAAAATAAAALPFGFPTALPFGAALAFPPLPPLGPHITLPPGSCALSRKLAMIAETDRLVAAALAAKASENGNDAETVAAAARAITSWEISAKKAAAAVEKAAKKAVAAEEKAAKMEAAKVAAAEEKAAAAAAAAAAVEKAAKKEAAKVAAAEKKVGVAAARAAVIDGVINDPLLAHLDKDERNPCVFKEVLKLSTLEDGCVYISYFMADGAVRPVEGFYTTAVDAAEARLKASQEYDTAVVSGLLPPPVHHVFVYVIGKKFYQDFVDGSFVIDLAEIEVSKFSGCTSPLNGISWNTRMSLWLSSTHIIGGIQHVGFFTCEMHAALARAAFEMDYLSKDNGAAVIAAEVNLREALTVLSILCKSVNSPLFPTATTATPLAISDSEFEVDESSASRFRGVFENSLSGNDNPKYQAYFVAGGCVCGVSGVFATAAAAAEARVVAIKEYKEAKSRGDAHPVYVAGEDSLEVQISQQCSVPVINFAQLEMSQTPGSSSIFKGVIRQPLGWNAKIFIEGKRYSLGYYNDELVAAFARAVALQQVDENKHLVDALVTARSAAVTAAVGEVEDLDQRPAAVLANQLNASLLEDLSCFENGEDDGDCDYLPPGSSSSGGNGKKEHCPQPLHDRRRTIIIGKYFFMIDYADKELILWALANGYTVIVILTHAHSDHAKILNTVYFKDFVAKGQVHLYWTKETAAAVRGANNALGFQHLAGIDVARTVLLDFETCYSFGDTADMYFSRNDHCPGAAIVYIVEKGTGACYLHTGDLLATSMVQDSMLSRLTDFQARYGNFHLENVVLDDTRYNLDIESVKAETLVDFIAETVTDLIDTSGYDDVTLVLTDGKFCSRVGPVTLPLARKLGADVTLHLPAPSFHTVRALNAVGDPSHACIDNVKQIPDDEGEPLDGFAAATSCTLAEIASLNSGAGITGGAEVETGAKIRLIQMRQEEFYLKDGKYKKTLKTLCERLGGGDGKLVMVWQLSGWYRFYRATTIAGTGFETAWIAPTKFSEHSGFRDQVRVVRMLLKFGMKESGLCLLTSYGPYMYPRVKKLLYCARYSKAITPLPL